MNTCRKDFAPSEALAIAERVEKLYKPVAEMAEARGKSADGKAGGRGKKNPVQSLHRVSDSKKTRVVAAAASGRSHATLKKVKAVVEAAKKDPAYGRTDRTPSANGCIRSPPLNATDAGGAKRTAGKAAFQNRSRRVIAFGAGRGIVDAG